MDFTLTPEVDALRASIRQFVDDRLIPLEADGANYDVHENIAPGVLARLRGEARAQGLWALQMPVARGGRGLRTRISAGSARPAGASAAWVKRAAWDRAKCSTAPAMRASRR